MDEHRKMAEEIANKFSHLFAITGGGTYSSWYRLIDEMENALRTTASKSEKDGWNKAVKRCSEVACLIEADQDEELDKIRAKASDDIFHAICRLIREDGK